ncbi:cyanogenic beta-glucosidase [Manihot esculenta]|uniref:Beta-glucosidase n=1 Tax=Manihot esculenta TaxID=3983 RepID=A0A2C9V807_MANES|nr:cyanogenic beta-glucosidase [Manihot esculenta]OAY40096.1 hypothetical protein MANES_10G149500v8 [Manihot esculenta]
MATTMVFKHSLPLAMLVFLIGLLPLNEPAEVDDNCIPDNFNSSYFGDKFIFGTATSAYQIEGGTDQIETGRGLSVWDTFTHDTPERIKDHTNGDIAVDFYHRYGEDIKNVKKMGFKAFRMSISWPRVIPTGRISKGKNQKGIAFYHQVLDKIIQEGLEPFVTIFHWDTPQFLETEYRGFLSPNIVDDYRDYVRLLFDEFGKKVKYWMTFNEPWALSGFAYDKGVFAPGRCSSWINSQCLDGNSATEPYIVAHHLLLAHAAAVELHRSQEYKSKLKEDSKIGITLFTFWFEPLSNKRVDIEASETALDFMFGLWMEPLTYGRYPRRVKNLVGDKLHSFTERQSQLLKKSYDFIGLQYYTAYYAKPHFQVEQEFSRYETDSHVEVTALDYKDKPIGKRAYSPWFYIYPKGIRHLLKYTKERYSDPLIYITENGIDTNDIEGQPVKEAVKDTIRIDYYRNHTWNVLRAIKDDEVNVQGYFAWSYIDNFEWNIGYTSRFGLYYVDFKDPKLPRTAKDSAIWFCEFLKNKKSELCKLRPDDADVPAPAPALAPPPPPLRPIHAPPPPPPIHAPPPATPPTQPGLQMWTQSFPSESDITSGRSRKFGKYYIF